MAINEGFEDELVDEAELRVLTWEQSLDAQNLLKDPKTVLIDPMYLNRLERLGYLEVTGNPGVWFMRS